MNFDMTLTNYIENHEQMAKHIPNLQKAWEPGIGFPGACAFSSESNASWQDHLNSTM